MSESALEVSIEEEAPVEPKRRNTRSSPCLRSSLSLAEHASVTYVLLADETVSRETLTDPMYWKLVAPQLRPNTIIQVHPLDGSYWAELLVTESGANYAVVKELRFVPIDMEKPMDGVDDIEDLYDIKRSTGNKYKIYRKGEADPVFDGLPTKEAARQKLRMHIQALRK